METAFAILKVLQGSNSALPLREIASRSGLTPSAANNYLVSLVRTNLARLGDRTGHYQLGVAALSLGMSALQQIDGYETVRSEVTALRDATGYSTALAAWTEAGPISVFKQDGEHRSAFELRTGLIPVTSTATGRIFLASLADTVTLPLVKKELSLAGRNPSEATEVIEVARREFARDRYLAVTRAHPSGYASIAAPVWNANGEVHFAISLIDPRNTIEINPGSPLVTALLNTTMRATAALGGLSHMV